MNKEVYFIADFFAEQILGGGELNNHELVLMLREKNYNVIEKQSHDVTLDFIEQNKNCFFIIANFVNLSQNVRIAIQKKNYVIYEHDHKYLRSRNPASYKNFKASDRDILNFHFYKNAKAVLCQSSFHKKVIEANLALDNIINLGGNLWSLESLEKMRHFSKCNKKDVCSIMNSKILHKNTAGAIRYCISNDLDYELVSSSDYFDFLEKLGSNKKFVFLPKTAETLSRIVVEARMMGCSVLTNGLVGATSESWFNLKGEELIDFMISKREEILSVVEGLISKPISFKKKPLVSMLNTFHEAEKYLDNFLLTVTEQTIFEDCELIIIDANSPGREQEIVKKYCEKYDNIVYVRLDEKLLPSPCFNAAIKLASADFLTFAHPDDVKRKDCIEILYNKIVENKDVALVYGDVLQTKKENDSFENNESDGTLMEHSKPPFTKENMIKCLPGPMPLWSVKIHEKCGFFDSEACNYADDWEMWLRAVDSGFKFEKIDDIVGLYLVGGRSQQDNPDQRKEEAEIFYKYSHLFGSNYTKYKPYFDQFLRNQQ